MTEADWALMVAVMKFLESHWQEPDEGIWEVRGGRQQFTHSKMMAWLAFDRAIKLVENCGCAAHQHFDRWKKIRDQIHTEVCERGYNRKKKAFTQVYGSDALDASRSQCRLPVFCRSLTNVFAARLRRLNVN